MKFIRNLLYILILCGAIQLQAQEYALVIHGGAGHMQRGRYSAEEDQAYRTSLTNALLLGQVMLAEGERSVDVVEAVINMLENDSLFNAGKGSVLNINGAVECDASIMSGIDKNAGAVAGVSHLKNPISSARLVMEKSPHVLLCGSGAEEFVKPYKVEFVDNSYFITSAHAMQFAKRRAEKKHGTVGAVALDISGNIAAGTSTGGMSDKAFNRVGDSPLIGAGTYADNNTCGVSCTGHGEFFIRYAVAYDVSALMEYKAMSVQDAATYVIQEKLVKAGGDGGLIALDAKGNIAMEYNTPGMFRGYINRDEIYVALYKDE
jgi:beta-aspartyl-peptidase (threonine type)